VNPLGQVLEVQAAIEKAAPQLSQLQQSCTALEANFLKSLVQEMQKSVDTVHYGDELGGDIYKDMFQDSMSSVLAQKHSLGLSNVMYGPLSSQVLKQALQSVHAAANGQAEKNNQ
jgi:Rod binding domain-containing protein